MLFSIDFYCVFRYCGEHFDTESGTVYLRARYYNPVTGRFISRDSYTGEHGDPLSLNLYTYCHNNPILGVDPSGHSFWEYWQIGVDSLSNMGGLGEVFASYSIGVVDSCDRLSQGAANFIMDPCGTINKSITEFTRDPLRNNALYSIGEFYIDLAYSSYNHDWNSVAYSLGGATPQVGMVAASTYLGASMAGKIAPNGINVNLGGQCAFAGGGCAGNAVVISASAQQVASASALTSGAVAGNVVYALGGNNGNGGRVTTPEATAVAKQLGYTKVSGQYVHGQPVYTNGKHFISPDVDSHIGGYWKMADTINNLRSKRTRMGTYDINLNRIGD